MSLPSKTEKMLRTPSGHGSFAKHDTVNTAALWTKISVSGASGVKFTEWLNENLKFMHSFPILRSTNLWGRKFNLEIISK